ncbi:MAG: DUF6607 family protein [Hyphomonas sp.]
MRFAGLAVGAVAPLLLQGCAADASQRSNTQATPIESNASAPVDAAAFAQDRAAILAMEGDYKVTFDFRETVPLAPGYEPKSPKLSGAYEVVRVIEDRSDFISLQHILAIDGDRTFPVKHWRQDWQYEPERVLVFIGGNTWTWRDVPEAARRGAWSQTVFQVDDAPRYGAVASWTHEAGLAEWTSPREWRPLPRRDMTTRDDYHAIDAMNRHVITPDGWVHEQDNTKLVLGSVPTPLVREIGVNTYVRTSDFSVSVATDYWDATEDFWAEIRDEWAQIEGESRTFGLTLQGETEELYNPLLELAGRVAASEGNSAQLTQEGRAMLRQFVTFEPDPLEARIAATPAIERAE